MGIASGVAKLLAALLVLGLGANASACESTLPLDGQALNAPTCSQPSAECVAGSAALSEYLSKSDDSPSRLTVGLQTSPWRMYGPDFRIISPSELADMLRPQLKKPVVRVELHGSWTGVAPMGSKSLASRVSTQLKGFPVSGLDGFMWVDKNGKSRTTRQSFTVRKGSGFYLVPKGSDVMAALTVGWASQSQEAIEKAGDAGAMLQAGVGWDAFMLCPETALATFERAARMGSAVAGYNAAVMRLDRGKAGDRQAAKALLESAVSLGDAPSLKILASLNAPAKKPASP